MVITALLVGAGTFVSVAVNPFAGNKRAKQARDMNSARQIKFALDGFAVDFDGQYPNKDTGARLIEGGGGTKTSNDFFRQLFMSGDTVSETIFWVSGATVCNKEKPDNSVGKGGKPQVAEILKAGDCGWAYLKDQTNTARVDRPIIVNAHDPASKGFDKKLYGGSAIVIRIDGSTRPVEIDAKGNLAGKNGNPLSANHDAWKGSGEDPAKLLVQPLPKK